MQSIAEAQELVRQDMREILEKPQNADNNGVLRVLANISADLGGCGEIMSTQTIRGDMFGNPRYPVAKSSVE